MSVPTAPRVSIVIPAHNAELWIEACVQSALAQTWGNTEVLVCDDGSTDRTATILQKFDPSIRVKRTKGIGSNAARNLLLSEASGEWIQFLDADDALLEDKIECQLQEGGALDEIDVLYSPTIDQYWEEGKLVSEAPSRIDQELDTYSQWFLWQLSQANGSLWRRSRLVEIGGWNENQDCCQDNELYSRALRERLRFRLCPSARAIYRSWSTQTISRRNPGRSLRARVQLMESMVAWLEKDGLSPIQRTSAGRAFLEVARQMACINIDEADALFRAKSSEGLISYKGPASPLPFTLTCRLFGFRTAERIAQWRRQPSAS